MKYAKKQLIFFIAYLAAGALICVMALLWAPAGQKSGIVTGIVSGFLVTGVGGIILSSLLMKNPKKAEQVEISKTEERTRFLRLKTHSTVYIITVFIVCAGTFAAEICGYRDIALTLAALLIIEVILYAGIGIYYSKKY